MAEIKDSGSRREFSTGAHRDNATGKGRCDLLPLKYVAEVMEDEVIRNISKCKYYSPIQIWLRQYDA